MAEYLIKDTSITPIANQIRTVRGTTDALPFLEILADAQKTAGSPLTYVTGSIQTGDIQYNADMSESNIWLTSDDCVPKLLIKKDYVEDWVAYESSYEYFLGLASGNGVIVALSESEASVSTDGGNTWIDVSVSDFAGEVWFTDLTYGAGKFVAVGYGCGATSTDGMTWSTYTNEALDMASVTGNDTILVARDSFGALNWSTNGEDWNACYCNNTYSTVFYGGGKFIALGYGIVASSTDGKTWDETAVMPNTDISWITGGYGNGVYVALAFNSTVAAYSTDGITWTETALPGGLKWGNVAYGNGKFMASATGSSTWVAVSKDGITWAEETINNVDHTFTSDYMIYDSGRFIATGEYAIFSKVDRKDLMLLSIDPVLDNNSWADISLAASMGVAPSLWSVGDCKAVPLNSTVGTLSVSGTYYAYILGFNHNGATNTIDFGTFKTALSGGTNICLIDGRYNYSAKGTKLFSMNHWSNYSLSGWKGCDLRYDILGSTNVAPSGYGSAITTSRVGYDASDTCATSPVSGTLMAALPSELRAVMKPMTIYTDNIGYGSNVAANVTTSIDYLPLLAEFEIFGTRSYANQYEQNYQAQYSYFSAGNSKVKYQHSSTGSLATWWERSPNHSLSNYFCSVNTYGNESNCDTKNSNGLAPAFRV